MKGARGLLRLGLIALWVTALALAGAADAQQPSKELQNLRDTTNALYKAGDYASALQFAERALPLVIREYGAEHEQTGIQYFSLGLVSRAAGDLAAAEKYYKETVRLREKVYGTDSPSVGDALDRLGGVYLRMGRVDAAEPLFRRSLKLRQDAVGPNHSYSASGHANLGEVALARGNWTVARTSYREAIRLVTGQDTSYEIVKQLVLNEIKEFRDAFVGLCRAIWQLRGEPGANRAQVIEETFIAGQLAWHTSAASALAKMAARLGTTDTDLGRRIRSVQDNADRVLALHAEDNKLLADWSAVQRANPAYSAASDEFRAASFARHREQAPTVKRQTELVQQLTALMQRCPPAQQKAGCDGADREREAISKELGALSQVTAKGSGEIMAIAARLEAAEKALPGYAQ